MFPTLAQLPSLSLHILRGRFVIRILEDGWSSDNAKVADNKDGIGVMEVEQLSSGIWIVACSGSCAALGLKFGNWIAQGGAKLIQTTTWAYHHYSVNPRGQKPVH